MMWNEYISLFFRFLNFGIFIACMIYIYKQYIYEMLFTSMKEEQLQVDTLKTQKQTLERQNNDLKERIHDDETLISALTHKIEQWAQAEQKDAQIKQDAKERHHHALIKKYESKKIRIAEYMIKKESLSHIVSQAHQELITYYSSTHHQHQYLNTALEALKKKSDA